MFADEQMNYEDCEQAETGTALAVAISQLDIVSSVAASVVKSLLLMSGDVEENPGPGGRYNYIMMVGSKCIYACMCMQFQIILSLTTLKY